jgi:hypothetical protein
MPRVWWPSLALLASLGACRADMSSDPAPGDAGLADGGFAEPDAGADAGADASAPPPDPLADCPRARVVTDGLPLNVRSEPSTDGAIVGSLAEGTIVDVVGRTTGEVVDDVTEWLEVDPPGPLRGFVSARWAECTTDEPPEMRGYYLPLACGRTARVSQGNNTTFSHRGYSRYAFDFAIPRGTRLFAMAPGRVIRVDDDTRPGDPCYDGGGPSCITEANLVWIRHPDGSVTSYAHLDAALVTRGERVDYATPIARSGSSGYSTGPHAHVARQEDCGAAGCQSIRLTFQDVPGDGVPETGDTVTSGNCR